jgi:DNA-binding HxlR family transcriptional regulator
LAFVRTAVAIADPPAHQAGAPASEREECCALFHRAVELVGKRWTGAILSVLLDGPLRFSEIRALVPDISDRLLSERLKELEAEGIVDRHVLDDHPVGVEYRLTAKGEALEPAVAALKRWAGEWLCH